MKSPLNKPKHSDDSGNLCIVQTADDAFELLDELNAPIRLIRHAELVLEVSEILIEKLTDINLSIAINLIRIGAILHDVGKISHPEELDKAGSKHLLAGKQLLLEKQLPERIARFCVSHKKWDETQNCTIEEFVVALADKLWKGTRHRQLEEQVVKYISMFLQKDYWQIYIALDSVFEEIADHGAERLLRSQK